MNRPDEDPDAEYKIKFWRVAPVLEKHFPNFPLKKIDGMTHMFIATEDVGLFETYDYNAQLKHLSQLRLYLGKISKHLEGLHHVVEMEVKANLSLPRTVLNGQHDRKTCAEEVFDTAPSPQDVEIARNALIGLKLMGDQIEQAIKYTEGDLPTGIPIRNRNIAAWKIVEAAVEVVRRYDCQVHIPKRMQGTGPMRRLLADLLDAHEIYCNVDAAFNGWLKHIDQKREDLDLLPID